MFSCALGSWTGAAELESFAAKVFAQGAPLKICVGVFECTMKVTCRPFENQKSAYSGFKSAHGLKFQFIRLPNWIIGDFYSPVECCRYDAAMLQASALLHRRQQNFNRPDETTYRLFGDSAYPISPFVLSPSVMLRELKTRKRGTRKWVECVSRLDGALATLYWSLPSWFTKRIWRYSSSFLGFITWLVVFMLTAIIVYTPIISQFFNYGPPVLEDLFDRTITIWRTGVWRLTFTAIWSFSNEGNHKNVTSRPHCALLTVRSFWW